MKMRVYAAFTTAALVMLLTGEALFWLSDMDVFGMFFSMMAAGVFTMALFLLVTRERKPEQKKKWVSGGGLEALIMMGTGKKRR